MVSTKSRESIDNRKQSACGRDVGVSRLKETSIDVDHKSTTPNLGTHRLAPEGALRVLPGWVNKIHYTREDLTWVSETHRMHEHVI